MGQASLLYVGVCWGPHPDMKRDKCRNRRYFADPDARFTYLEWPNLEGFGKIFQKQRCIPEKLRLQGRINFIMPPLCTRTQFPESRAFRRPQGSLAWQASLRPESCRFERTTWRPGILPRTWISTSRYAQPRTASNFSVSSSAGRVE